MYVNELETKTSCANEWLLNDVARGDWGFDGYITTDCGAANDVFAHHNYYPTKEETVAGILHAGEWHWHWHWHWRWNWN